MFEVRLRTIFMDRGGVLNCAVVRHEKPHAPCSEEEVELYGVWTASFGT
jgi:hypothetical protein